MANKVGVTAVLGLDQREFKRGMTQSLKFAKSVAVQFGALAIGAGVFSAREAIDFEKGMRKVNQIARLNGPEFRRLSNRAIDLSDSLGIAHRTLTEGLYQGLSAGVPTDNLLEFSKVASMAAIAGYTELETSVDAVTNVINAFNNKTGKDAISIFDTMFKTVEKGKIQFVDIAAGMSKVSGIANSLGISFEETMGIIAQMTAAGEAPERAFNKLAAMMRDLLSPNDALIKKTKELFNSTSPAQVAKSMGLAKFMQAISKSVGDSAEAMREFMPNARGFQGALQITGTNAKNANERIEDVANSTGALASAFAETEKTGARDIEKMIIQFQNLGVQIGKGALGPLKEMREVLSETLDEETIRPFAEGFAFLAKEVAKSMQMISDHGKTLGGWMEKLVEKFYDLKEIGEKEQIGMQDPFMLAAAGRLKAAGITPDVKGLMPRADQAGRTFPTMTTAGMQMQPIDQSAFTYQQILESTAEKLKMGEQPWQTEQRLANTYLLDLLNVTKERLPEASQ